MKTQNPNSFLREVRNLLTFGDKVLMVFLVLLGCLSMFAVKWLQADGWIAVIAIQNEREFSKPLDRDEIFQVMGPAGVTRIAVDSGKIRILDSDCPQKLCVHQGAIQNVGEIIVCVPNKVSIWIEGTRRNKFDAITG